MDAKHIIAELQGRLDRADESARRLSEHGDIDRWIKSMGCSVSEVYETIAAELAKGYSQGRYSFELCDDIANELFRAWGQMALRDPTKGNFPELFYEVFLAFDAGEFHHLPDKSDDPVKDYTDPLIAKILVRF